MRKATITLADGRALTYFGDRPSRPDDYPDRRTLPPRHVEPQARRDPLLDEWVVIASHRQDRTFQPALAECPLCPSTPTSLTEIPAPEYDVVVFEENRFHDARQRQPILRWLFPGQPTCSNITQCGGRCRVVVAMVSNASFANLTEDQAAIVMATWVDRSVEARRPAQRRAGLLFENRGAEIGAAYSTPPARPDLRPTVRHPRTSRNCCAR